MLQRNINQLFIANNDVIELGWLERESYSTDRSKLDGVLQGWKEFD